MHADEPGSRDKAQQLRNDGAAALKGGDAATASENFRRAYELFPSPNLLYDLGLALDKLGRCVEAVDAFETFLDRAPSALPAARSYATKRLTVLEPCVARLELTAVPAEARVAVDGRAVELPRARPLAMTPGEHIVTVEKSGFVSRVEHVTLGAGEERALSMTLVPQPAPVARIEARPTLIANPVPEHPALSVTTARTRPVRHTPLYRRWWLWTAVGVVATGAAVGLGVGLTARPFSSTLSDFGPGTPSSMTAVH